jgi:hypothetical protein
MGLSRGFYAGFLALAACAADERPPAEEVSSSLVTANDPGPPVVYDRCEPGMTRACKVFWRSLSDPNIQHCRLATQTCNDDGSDWSACGGIEGTKEN